MPADGPGRALERRRIRHRSSDERHRPKTSAALPNRSAQASTSRCSPARATSASGSASALPYSRPTGETADELLSNSHHGAEPRQGDPARRPRAVRGLDPPRTGNAPDAGSRTGAGRGAQRVRTVLPATTASGRRPPDRRRSPDPLASSGAWPGFAGGIHAGRQHLADFRANCGVGSRNRLRQGSRLGARRTQPPDRRQPFALATPVGRPCRLGRAGACRAPV